jgi:hypothetical protein
MQSRVQDRALRVFDFEVLHDLPNRRASLEELVPEIAAGVGEMSGKELELRPRELSRILAREETTVLAEVDESSPSDYATLPGALDARAPGEALRALRDLDGFVQDTTERIGEQWTMVRMRRDNDVNLGGAGMTHREVVERRRYAAKGESERS